MELLQVLKFSRFHILIMPQFNLFWIAWKQNCEVPHYEGRPGFTFHSTSILIY